MKNIKKIALLFILFIISGCSVNYNLTLNEDMTVSEKVVASEKTKRMEAYTRMKGDQAVSYLYNIYKLEGINYSIITREKNDTTYSTVTTSYSDINEYASNFHSDVFKNVNVTKDGNNVYFEATQSELLSNSGNYNLLYDDITVYIKIPFKVIDSNADEVNKNTYIWKIKKSDTYKTIKFSYKNQTKVDSLNVNINKKTYNINYGIIILISTIVIIGLFILFIYIKNKKNNAMS